MARHLADISLGSDCFYGPMLDLVAWKGWWTMVVSLITVYKSGQTVRLEIDAVVEHEFQVHGVGFQVVRITEYIDHKLTPVQVAKDGLCCYPIGQEFSDPDLDLCDFIEKAESFTEEVFLLGVEKWERRAASYPLELPGFD